jgi:hypothetical protein
MIRMNKKAFFRSIAVLFLVALLAAMFGGCQTFKKESDIETTSEPAVVTAEPVVTYSDALALPYPDGESVPAGYTRVETEEAPLALFAFTDADGAVQYRVYGGYDQLQDGAVTESCAGFYRSDETGAILSEADAFIDPATEAFGSCTPSDLPETLRLRTAYQALESTGLCTDGEGITMYTARLGTMKRRFIRPPATVP